MRNPIHLLLLLAGLMVAGCSTVSSSLPLQYQDADTGLAISLPASWKGFSIVHDEQGWVPADLKTVFIRHPRWSAKDPYVDIKIYAYTLEQWVAYEKRGVFGIGAGGVETEIYSNSRYVFAQYSRDINYAFGPEDPGFAKGGDEVSSIIHNLFEQHPEAKGTRH